MAVRRCASRPSHTFSIQHSTIDVARARIDICLFFRVHNLYTLRPDPVSRNHIIIQFLLLFPFNFLFRLFDIFGRISFGKMDVCSVLDEFGASRPPPTSIVPSKVLGGLTAESKAIEKNGLKTKSS